MQVPEALSGTQVLVVDDDSTVRQAVVQVLTRVGARVVAVEDGEQALKTLRKHRLDQFDWVLSDLRMPKVGGLQLYQRLQAESPELLTSRFVFMTGELGDDEVARGVVSSGRPWILKPFTAQALVSTLLLTQEGSEEIDSQRRGA